MSAITIALLTFLCLFFIGGQGHDQISANNLSKRNVDLNKSEYFKTEFFLHSLVYKKSLKRSDFFNEFYLCLSFTVTGMNLDIEN